MHRTDRATQRDAFVHCDTMRQEGARACQRALGASQGCGAGCVRGREGERAERQRRASAGGPQSQDSGVGAVPARGHRGKRARRDIAPELAGVLDIVLHLSVLPEHLACRQHCKRMTLVSVLVSTYDARSMVFVSEIKAKFVKGEQSRKCWLSVAWGQLFYISPHHPVIDCRVMRTNMPTNQCAAVRTALMNPVGRLQHCSGSRYV